jgi:hypothetical protein
VSYNSNADYLDPDPAEGGTLLDVLDTLLDAGIVIAGDVRISVAGVDLLYVGLKLLASSIETAQAYQLAPLLKERAA